MRPLTVRNFGGVDQVQMLDAEDLARIDSLDPSRWAATSAPLADLHCDTAFLGYVDGDGKGRIRVAQVIAGRDWLFERLSGRTHISKRTETLLIADLDQGRDAGKALRKAAEHVLEQLKEKARDGITLEQVRRFRAAFADSLANGDGVVCAGHVPDAAVAALVTDIVATTGGAKDLSGKEGAGEKELSAFLEGAKGYLAWKAKPDEDKAILPWGAETAAAADMVRGLDTKVEEYFWICDLLRQEAATLEKLRLSGDDWKTFKSKDAATIELYLAESPLAPPSPEGKLALAGVVNPVYAERFEALGAKVLAKALGKTERELTRASWRRVRSTFDPYWAWRKAKPAPPFEKLDESKLAALADGELAAELRRFIGVDLAAKSQLERLAELEKIVLYQRWLLDLVNNFVNFSAIYLPQETALVEVGALVIDGRRFEFCVKVQDRAAHKKVAAESLIFLVYAEIRDKESDKPVYEVMAPVTAGERGRLRVGKRGIFVDVKGKEWDSVIVDVVENPISIIEAVKAPFRRAAAFISKKIEDLAASQLTAAESKATAAGAGAVDKAAAPGAAPAPAPGAPTAAPGAAPAPAPGAPAAAPAPAPAGGGMQSMVLIGSIAFAALSTAATFIVSTFAKIGVLDLVGGIAGILALICTIAAFLGWLKLRRRDLSLVLEAQGWAVNIEMKVNRRIAGIMTLRPALPEGTLVDRTDVLLAWKSDDEKRSERRRAIAKGALLLVIVLLLALFVGAFYFPPILNAWKALLRHLR